MNFVIRYLGFLSQHFVRIMNNILLENLSQITSILLFMSSIFILFWGTFPGTLISFVTISDDGCGILLRIQMKYKNKYILKVFIPDLFLD
jgi:hypothetical protein